MVLLRVLGQFFFGTMLTVPELLGQIVNNHAILEIYDLYFYSSHFQR